MRSDCSPFLQISLRFPKKSAIKSVFEYHSNHYNGHQQQRKYSISISRNAVSFEKFTDEFESDWIKTKLTSKISAPSNTYASGRDGPIPIHSGIQYDIFMN